MLEKAYHDTKNPLSIADECLMQREKRQGIDMVHDDVERSLTKVRGRDKENASLGGPKGDGGSRSPKIILNTYCLGSRGDSQVSGKNEGLHRKSPHPAQVSVRPSLLRPLYSSTDWTARRSTPATRTRRTSTTRSTWTTGCSSFETLPVASPSTPASKT